MSYYIKSISCENLVIDNDGFNQTVNNSISLNDNKITDLADPINPQDAVNLRSISNVSSSNFFKLTFGGKCVDLNSYLIYNGDSTSKPNIIKNIQNIYQPIKDLKLVGITSLSENPTTINVKNGNTIIKSVTSEKNVFAGINVLSSSDLSVESESISNCTIVDLYFGNELIAPLPSQNTLSSTIPTINEMFIWNNGIIQSLSTISI